jgi:hypothetical protein
MWSESASFSENMYFKMKFPTSGFILKNDMSADKNAFHRNVNNKKKNWPI